MPLKPFIAVSIRDVLPDCPGLATVIDAGLATMLKSGAAVTRTLAFPCDPVCAPSPEYVATTVTLPTGSVVDENTACPAPLRLIVPFPALPPLTRKPTLPVGTGPPLGVPTTVAVNIVFCPD